MNSLSKEETSIELPEYVEPGVYLYYRNRLRDAEFLTSMYIVFDILPLSRNLVRGIKNPSTILDVENRTKALKILDSLALIIYYYNHNIIEYDGDNSKILDYLALRAAKLDYTDEDAYYESFVAKTDNIEEQARMIFDIILITFSDKVTECYINKCYNNLKIKRNEQIDRVIRKVFIDSLNENLTNIDCFDTLNNEVDYTALDVFNELYNLVTKLISKNKVKTK